MKKRTILILSIIALLMTFTVSEILSIYHFGSIPTLITSLYLISIFSIFEYLSISITYTVRKLIKKEKLQIKNVIGLILLFVALLFILLFSIVVDVDYLNRYMYSSPFYLNLIVRCIEFLLPSIALIVISVSLMKNQKKK